MRKARGRGGKDVKEGGMKRDDGRDTRSSRRERKERIKHTKGFEGMQMKRWIRREDEGRRKWGIRKKIVNGYIIFDEAVPYVQF